MSEPFSQAIGKVVHEYTWLMVDALLLLLLLGGLLNYKDLDDSARQLVRGTFLLCIAYFWISGLHLLVYLRRADREMEMPAWASYPLFALKAALLIAFACWARHRGIV